MSDYQSSDTFQQLNTTESNGYNVFPGAYMSKGVGGKRSKSIKKDKKANKDKKRKGGDCGCKANTQQNSLKFFGGKRNYKRSMKNKKNNTKKDRQ
jgi:hypothetical protein